MRERVLIVEDSATQREALRTLLEEQAYRVTEAAGGAEALELARTQRFDLVITDVLMPDMDGYELCERLKAELRAECPAIILLTSLNNPTDIIRGLESGADNFLTKPYEEEQLLSRIQFVVANRKLRERARAEIGVVINFLGRTFTITSERQQILDLLLTTYEDAVLQNRRLREREEELRAAREELARYAGSLEERLQSILVTVPDVLFSIDVATDRPLYVSPAAERVLGLAPDAEASREQWWAGLGSAGGMQYAAAKSLALRTGQAQEAALRYRRPDGAERWLEVTLSPAKDKQGAVVRLDGIARDVTERRRLEDELRQAQKMEAIGALAGGIAHDFNNLLAAMKSTVDLMVLEGKERGAVREGVTQLAEVVERARGLTQQLLTFSRRQEVEAKPVDVNELLINEVKMLKRLLGKEVRLSLTDAAPGATVLADPNQLDQVFMNLCVNARDAMPGGGAITMRTERVSVDEALVARYPWARPGEYVRVSVRDTGTGMSEEVLGRIFEPFFTTKAPGHGTGLGMAVVYGIVKQHGGLITVQSELGKGTTFDVYLPYFAGAAPAKRRAALASGALVGGTETILIADDEEVLRRTARRILERLGYRVLEAADGAEALEILETRGAEIQLAISDVAMPNVGGLVVRDAIRARYPHIRILFATGYGPESPNVRTMNLGAEQVLSKPFGIAELAHAVRKALDTASVTT